MEPASKTWPDSLPFSFIWVEGQVSTCSRADSRCSPFPSLIAPSPRPSKKWEQPELKSSFTGNTTPELAKWILLRGKVMSSRMPVFHSDKVSSLSLAPMGRPSSWQSSALYFNWRLFFVLFFNQSTFKEVYTLTYAPNSGCNLVFVPWAQCRSPIFSLSVLCAMRGWGVGWGHLLTSCCWSFLKHHHQDGRVCPGLFSRLAGAWTEVGFHTSGLSTETVISLCSPTDTQFLQ